MPLPRSVATINRAVTNRLTRPLAAQLPGFALVVHRGRRTGQVYLTPVNVFRRPGGFIVALTYGRGDWVENVLHAGRGVLVTRGRPRPVTNPRVVRNPDHAQLPAPVRTVLRVVHADEELHLDDR